MSQTLKFCIIQHNSPEYHEAIQLRQEVLRSPLGMVYSLEDLKAECDQIHIIGKLNHEIICSASIAIHKDFCKIRQVAVKNSSQKTGIGRQLMAFCEQHIQQLGIKRIELHARVAVVNFYLKNNYMPIGEQFYEVNLPHLKMIKVLD